MYTSFYSLTDIPFSISTDPRFLWCGEKHRETLANLGFGLTKADGYVVLTGDIGLGKTTLVNSLLQTLDSNVRVANICHPTLSSLESFNLIAHAYGAQAEITRKTQFLSFSKTFLQNSYREGKTVLLIIDEAHLLSEELFEAIRLLFNIKKEDNTLFTLFLVGQLELKEILQRSQNRDLHRKITLFCEINPLSEQETMEYVAHRLKVAGARNQVFSSAALCLIHGFSQGYPRLINILCDHALLTGYVKDQLLIDQQIVSECIKKLQYLHSQRTSSLEQGDSEMLHCPPAENILSDDKRPDLNVGQKSTNETPPQEVETVDDNLRTHPIHMGRRLFRFPALGLILLVVLPVATIIDWQHLTFYSRYMQPAKQQSEAPQQAMLTPEEEKLSTLQIQEKPVSVKTEEKTFDPQMTNIPSVPETVDAPSSTLSRENLDKKTVSHATAEQTIEDPAHAPRLLKLHEEVSNRPPSPTPLELATIAVKHGDFQTALDILDVDNNKVRDTPPQQRTVYTAALVGRAQQIAVKSPAQALFLLRHAVELDTDNVRALFLLGKIYTELQEYKSAIAAYQQVQTLEPNYSDALFNLGFLYATVGMYENAELLFSRVVQLKPGYIHKALFNLAIMQEKLGKYEECLENAKKAAALSPDNQRIQNYLQILLAAVQESSL